MNTGEKNTLGRTIFKGPKGGTYVLSGTKKVYKYTKAAAAAPPPSRVEPPKNTKGRIIYKGAKGGLYVLNGSKKVYSFSAEPSNRMRAKASYTPSPARAPTPAPGTPAGYTKTVFMYREKPGDEKYPVYTKTGGRSTEYWVLKPNRKKLSVRSTLVIRGSYIDRLNHAIAANKASKVAEARRTVTNYPGHTKTNYTSTFLYYGGAVYRKNATGRYFVRTSNGSLASITRDSLVRNSSGVTKPLGEYLKAAKGKAPAAAPKPKKVGGPATVAVSPGSGKMPTPSPRAVISTAERNRRLAEIRARLNAIKAKIRAEKPKTRKNVENKLRMAYWRARARISKSRENLQGKPTTTITIPTCHAPASVPRKKCTNRNVDVSYVYTGDQPLIKSGGVVAMHKDDFDLDWFKRQNTYISKLTDYDFWTVQAHTNRSHSWIGPYTYKGTIPRFDALGSSTHIRPLWPQIRKLILNGSYSDSAWTNAFKATTSEAERYRMYSNNITRLSTNIKKEALEMYKKDLKRIIAGAPKAKKKMILYRGSSFDIFNGTKGHWYNLRSFCSAAYNVQHAAGYGSTVTRITVLPGTPVLFVAGTNQWDYAGEYEVMVNIDTKYLIRSRDVKRHVYYGGSRRNKYNPFRVTDVIIAK